MRIYKYCILLILLFVITSCTGSKDDLKSILLNDKGWYDEGLYFPLYMSLYGELEKDTISVVSSARELMDNLNIQVISYDLFPQLLYDELKHNKGCLNVDKYVFEWYKKYAIIKRNNIVDSIYKNVGIYGVLKYALDKNGNLKKFHQEGNYIIYLCFQHGVYFYNSENEIKVMPKTIKHYRDSIKSLVYKSRENEFNF